MYYFTLIRKKNDMHTLENLQFYLLNLECSYSVNEGL